MTIETAHVQPAGVVRSLLADPTNPELAHRLVAHEATYVSLNFDNPELRRIMPWTGTRKGPEAVLDTYTRVNRYWRNEGFEIEQLFGEGQNVARFGRFTYRSVTLGKAVTSPFAIRATVTDGRIIFMQFMRIALPPPPPSGPAARRCSAPIPRAARWCCERGRSHVRP